MVAEGVEMGKVVARARPGANAPIMMVFTHGLVTADVFVTFGSAAGSASLPLQS